MKPHLKFHGLRYPRSLSEAFGDVRAGCVYHYTRPSVWRRLMRALRSLL